MERLLKSGFFVQSAGAAAGESTQEPVAEPVAVPDAVTALPSERIDSARAEPQNRSRSQSDDAGRPLPGDPERDDRNAMSLDDKTLHLCSCNGTMPLDAEALARALELSGTPALKTMLCQKELAAFADRAGGDVVVACTQEARLFGDVAEEGGTAQTIRFVNIRETGGWSAEARAATPKIAALLALAGLPEPEPVPRVSYRSEGRLLIVGPAQPRSTGRACSRRNSP